MTPVIGGLAINLALGLAFVSIILHFFYLRNGDGRLFLSGQRAALAVSLLSILATLILAQLLITSNFDVDYVAHYTSLETPFIYKITALWAGQSGSLLFWLFTLSVYAVITILQNQRSQHKIMPWVMIVMTTVQLFFLILINYVSNPFIPTEADFVVANGLGLNPLLQNITMAFHPPMLYLGYVGFTIPFSFSIAAMAERDMNALWMRTVRQWLLFVWLMLSIGIILGGWWAYQELGWGGYWAWDPVENVSFIPWLLCTAFLHSSIVQRKNNSLINWNYVLVGLMFSSTIYGTFITRSGVLMSVHSFSNGPIGRYLLVGLFTSLYIFLIVGWKNENYFKQSRKISNLSGTFGLFTMNNILLSISAFVILIGTSYPIYFEVVNHKQISIGRGFYDQLVGPIFLIIIFLMILGVNTKVKATNIKTVFEQENLNLIISLVFSFVLSFFVIFKSSVAITFVLSLWLIVSIIHKTIKFITNKSKFGSDKTYWSGQIAHFGIAVLSIGIIMNMTQSYSDEYEVKSGEIVNFANEKFSVGGINIDEFDEKKIISLNILNHNKVITPAINIFKNSFQQGISTPGVDRGIFSDTYITIKSIEDEKLKLIFKKNMGIQIIWIGMSIIALSQIWKVMYGFKRK